MTEGYLIIIGLTSSMMILFLGLQLQLAYSTAGLFPRIDDDNNNDVEHGPFPGLGSDGTEVEDPAASDPSGIITKVNENISTYENTEHGFAFEFPGFWNRTADPSLLYSLSSIGDPGLLLEVKVEPYLPENVTDIISELMPTANLSKPSFEVKVYKGGSYLDPETLQVKNNTAEEFGRERAQVVESMFRSSSSPSAVSITNQITKNEMATIAGKADAWRLDYLTSIGGKQSTFNIEGFLIDDEGKLFKLSFSTYPLNVPQMMPEFEKILQSFRFI